MPIDLGRDKPSASLSILIVKSIFLLICAVFVSHLVRPFVNLSETIAGYRSNRSPLLIMLTEPTFCRNSSINISIDNRYDNDLFTSEDRYLPWITTAPVFTIPTTLGIAHARVTLARHRSPNLRTGCRIIWSSGCTRNRQGSGTKYRLSRHKNVAKIGTIPGRFRHIPGP